MNCYCTAGVLLLRNELAVLHLYGSAQYLGGYGVCLVASACVSYRDPVTVPGVWPSETISFIVCPRGRELAIT